MTGHLLSFMLFLPLAGLALVLVLPEDRPRWIRLTASAVSLATFMLSLAAAAGFHSGLSGFQLVERAPWIPTLGVQYALKLLSYPARLLQTGKLQTYALFVVMGLIGFLGYFAWPK